MPCEASRARARVGIAMLCREIASEADAAGGKSRSILRVLQAAKVEATGGDARAAGGRFPRDLAVFDHEHLSDPTKAAALSVVFVRWEAMEDALPAVS